MAFTCSFVSLTIYKCLLKSQNQNFLGGNCGKKGFFFTKAEKKILTLNHYEQVIVSSSVAVMYKLSLYVIPLCEPIQAL